MSTAPARRTPRSLALAGLALLACTTLGACGGDDGGDGASPATGTDLAETQVESGLPEECLDAFPVAVGEPELSDVTMLPADWPEPPVEATLCQTSATLDDSVETADFASPASPAEVLDAYEAALPYETTREDQGLGEVLIGTAGDVGFQISTRDGAFSIAVGG